MTTPLKDRIAILAELSLAHTNDWLDKSVADFCVVNNISIPLAFAVDYGYAVLTDKGAESINITFDNLLTLAGLEDTGYQELSDLYDSED
jgi:hypothetical protein